ncbi:hypothetical protein ORN12_02970 [Pantoea vagans]|uniref:hypothetical protein n=1 Tax=Pantoea vagans TaxID=470934 RepID=UPI0022582F7D|nr:hypothetical protein [Pantoea vagans]MCX3307973.1 hypothetical protein [Pantoea vagans]
MKNKNIEEILASKAANISPNKERELSHHDYEFLLKDSMSLALYLRHSDDEKLRFAAQKLLSDLSRLFVDDKLAYEVISEIRDDVDTSVQKDKNTSDSICPHNQFNSLWGKVITHNH